MPSYNGTMDPKQHLYKYSWHMDGARAMDAVRCRCFPTFLEGVASMWFTRLPSRSISTFYELVRKFLEQFGLHMAQPKDVMSLSDLFQGSNESLKSFMNQFNTAVTEVSNPNEDMIFMALVRAIHPDTDFGRWIKMKQPTAVKEFNWKASHYMRLEVANALKDKTANVQSKEIVQSNVMVNHDENNFGAVTWNAGKMDIREGKTRLVVGVMVTWGPRSIHRWMTAWSTSTLQLKKLSDTTSPHEGRIWLIEAIKEVLPFSRDLWA